MKYFKNCKTAEELKKEYRKLAMKLHPDIVGGDGEEFKVMQAEFEKLWERLKNVHQNAKGETYAKTSETTTETPKEFINIINTLIRLNGLEVEICGSWIWVSGNTKEHKEILKQLALVLEARELIKVKILETAMLDTKVAANEIAASLQAECVQAIGSKFVLFKRAVKKENHQIELPKK